MLNTYLEPIITAWLVFPFLAFVFTIPYLIYEYHKYGAVLFFRTVIVYSFVLYLLTSYFLVILPLPPRSLVAHYTSSTVQLHLGQFLKDIASSTHFIWNDVGSYLSFLKSPSVYTVLFNLILTFPFGVYLRYYYEKKWYQVVLYSFLLSLFFEGTQLSGLYGIYPRSYRLFDVDDLLINTLGGILGFGATPFFTKFLPSRASLDQKAFSKGRKVTLFRRMLAFLIDSFFAILLFFIVVLFFSHHTKLACPYLYYLGTVSIYFLISPLLLNGKTIGKWFVKLECVQINEKRAKWYQLFLRNVLLYLVILPTPYYLYLLLEKIPLSLFSLTSAIILGINFLFFLCQICTIFIGKRNYFGYERVSKTKNKSTLFQEE